MGAHGGMDGISGILRFAGDQMELRPTGELALVCIAFNLVFLASAVALFEAYEHHVFWRVAPVTFVFCGVTLLAYLFTSFRLDVQDRLSNEEIRREARKAIIAALDSGHVVLRPLDKAQYDVLRQLAKRNPDFRSRVGPLLRLGPAPKEYFTVEDSP